MKGITSAFKEFDQEDDEELLAMSLSTRPRSSPLLISSPLQQNALQPTHLASPPPLLPQKPFMQPIFSVPIPPPPPPPHLDMHLPSNIPKSHQEEARPSRPSRSRRSPANKLRQGKSETIPKPYPWATTRRAMVHSLEYLLANGINSISGEVQCKRCDQQYEIEYDLHKKFMEVAGFISKNKRSMHDRAPAIWMNPSLLDCRFCEQSNRVKPVLSEKKKSINWLFLLLGQMLGCCTLAQLKYFCKHTKNHRTGAKDRVLYLTYLGLCKQIDPTGPFDL